MCISCGIIVLLKLSRSHFKLLCNGIEGLSYVCKVMWESPIFAYEHFPSMLYCTLNNMMLTGNKEEVHSIA